MNTRRDFLKTIALGSAVASIVAACHSTPKELSCADTSALSDSDKMMRTTLKYEDKSTDASKQCSACNFFQKPATEGTCGGCTLIKGPINPGGKCSSWIAKQG